jgi:O-antigen/teichoic acid export membrane protein
VISWLIKRILTLTVVAGLIIAVSLILILSVPEVHSTLGLTSALPVLLLAVAVFLSLISPVGQGPLQGLQRFTSLGTISIVNYVLKLTIGVGMVILGYGVAGAVGGVLIGVAVAAALSLFMVRKYLLAPGQSVEGKEIWLFTLPAMVGILCFTILTQVDVIFAASLLPKPESDYYATASTLAKIILFLPGAVSTVMFPKISKAYAENGDTHRILKTAFVMTIFLAGLVVAVYFLIPNFVLSILIPGTANVSVRPAFAIVTFFGFAFGPIVGFFTGFVGNMIADQISGWGLLTSWNWSLANGFVGLLTGLFGVWLARTIPNRLLLAAVASAIAIVIGFLFVFTDIWLGTADDVSVALTANYLPVVISNLIAAVILTIERSFTSKERRTGTISSSRALRNISA